MASVRYWGGPLNVYLTQIVVPTEEQVKVSSSSQGWVKVHIRHSCIRPRTDEMRKPNMKGICYAHEISGFYRLQHDSHVFSNSLNCAKIWAFYVACRKRSIHGKLYVVHRQCATATEQNDAEDQDEHYTNILTVQRFKMKFEPLRLSNQC